MRRRLLVTYLTLTTFVLAVLAIPLGITFARNERRELVSDLQRDAFVLASRVLDPLVLRQPFRVAEPLRAYTARTGARVVVTDASGLAVADTDPVVAGPRRDFSTRPEIAAALRGELPSGIRPSDTAGGSLLYVAVPIARSGGVAGAIRLTFSTETLEARVQRSWISLAIVSLIALVAAALLALAFARWVTRPVRALAEVAGRLASGALDARADPGGGPPEVRALGTRFNEMAERLQELVAAQQAFVADASHQLRTPLTALRLRLENLEPALDARDRPDLEAAIAEADRLTRIVEGLLALARAEGARPERLSVDPVEIARDRAHAWEAFAAERGIRIQLEEGPACRALDVPGHLEQILDNLLANAVEASPADAAITIRTEASGDRCAIHVIDQGPGMSEEQRAHAFDRFHRSGRATGTGLGLAIVHQLAVASGGEVTLSSAPGGGLDAAVRLPVAR